MFVIETPRLVLIATPPAVVARRLQRDDFTAPLSIDLSDSGTGAAPVLVSFPPEWPGDAIAFFPELQRRYATDPDHEEWGGIMIDRERLVAVGQMSAKAPPDHTGTVEIGYGVNESMRGIGYATEMARAFTTWLLRQPAVRRVTAECLVDNQASVRVLDKSGFRRIGERPDDEGLLVLWERVR